MQAHVDPEFKINKKAMSENVPAAAQFAGLASLTYSSMFPNTPAMINWHGLRCNLSQVRGRSGSGSPYHLGDAGANTILF